MLTNLHLEGFKSFASADLSLGPFTVLLGANASGKSNLRDAFRFLHGVSRGYTLAEIIGEKWGEGGVLQWRGIRGGSREAVFPGRDTFSVKAEIQIDRKHFHYGVEVDPGSNGVAPRVVAESLYRAEELVFDTHPATNTPQQQDATHRVAAVKTGRPGRMPHVMFLADRPLLCQVGENDNVAAATRRMCEAARSAFAEMRFLDLYPDAMRRPSQTGQVVLGDRGENLASVLQAICEDPARKQALVEWVVALTPMDASDLKFVPDPSGRVHLVLLEENGQETSAESASDGTLRFLAMVAALLGPQPAAFYFFEELDNGIHPARLHLLLQLIEQQVARGGLQMVTTTHSPELLMLLRPDALEYASLTYRLPASTETRIRRLLDIPEARRVMESQDLWRLHAGGWFESALHLSQPDETAP